MNLHKLTAIFKKRWPALLLALLAVSVTLAVAGATPVITASKIDVLLVDIDGDGVADPGDTIRYTISLINTGISNATNVTFDDTIDGNTTLLGTAHVSPLAFADSYGSLGNVGINVPVGNGLLVNDVDPDNNSGTLTVVEVNGVGANVGLATATSAGGSVTVAVDGSFTYSPPPGFEGPDTFTYAISDGDPITPNDIDTVNITVANVIWFIDNTAGGGSNNGTLSDPFLGTTNFNISPLPAPGDIIFIHQGIGSYPGGINLQNNQILIGDGASATIPAIAGIVEPPFSNPLPVPSGTPPILTNVAGAGGNGINLAENNLVRGLDVGNTTGVGIKDDGGTVGNLTISEVSVTGIGGGFEADNGGTLNVSLDELSASSTGSNEGIHIAAGGSFGVTSGSISTSGVRAVNIDGDTTLALNVTLTSVSVSNNAVEGIAVRDTTGSFTVNGIGATDGSGGTIQDITQRGASFINAQNITLKNITFDDASTTDSGSNCQQFPSIVSSGCFAAVHMDSAQNIVLDNVDITDASQHAISGNSVTNFSLINSTATECGDGLNEDCVFFVNLDGTVLIENTDLAFPRSRPVYIHNTNENLNLTIIGSTFRDNQLIFGTASENTNGEDGMLVDINGSSTNTIDISNSNFLRIRTQAPQIVVRNTSVANVTIQGSTFDVGSGSFNIGRGPELLAQDTAQLIFDIKDNPTIISNGGRAILVAGAGNASIDGHIRQNTNIQGSNNAGGAILVRTEDNATGVVNVEANTASNTTELAIIRAQSRGGLGDLDVTINNNTTIGSVVTGLGQVGISVETVDANTMCANIINNSVTLGSGGLIQGTLNFDEAGGPLELQGFITNLDTTWNNNGNTVLNNTVLTSGTPSAPAGPCATPSTP